MNKENKKGYVLLIVDEDPKEINPEKIKVITNICENCKRALILKYINFELEKETKRLKKISEDLEI